MTQGGGQSLVKIKINLYFFCEYRSNIQCIYAFKVEGTRGQEPGRIGGQEGYGRWEEKGREAGFAKW